MTHDDARALLVKQGARITLLEMAAYEITSDIRDLYALLVKQQNQIYDLREELLREDVAALSPDEQFECLKESLALNGFELEHPAFKHYREMFESGRFAREYEHSVKAAQASNN